MNVFGSDVHGMDKPGTKIADMEYGGKDRLSPGLVECDGRIFKDTAFFAGKSGIRGYKRAAVGIMVLVNTASAVAVEPRSVSGEGY
jgi:hypothetical protein